MIVRQVKIDELIENLLDLEMINQGFVYKNHGRLHWEVLFDGDVFTITITHINEH